ncbi:uncharacterized protein PFLUO_LOCUS484 [Penicillium psychrofluorescens]|uniref:uncharacterized protein n=1 Tax=Penicillium psychrofluorescens TaxID=3158075 RepID=UPI003CCCFAC8
MEDSLSSLVQTWLDWDQDPTTRLEMETLRASDDTDELEKRLRRRIDFGTAGLRGRMAAGFSCMNCLTVIQASQGLAKYIRTRHPEIAAAGVVIGHDARHNSAKFASLAANAFLNERIPVWHYQEESPTPLVPFGIGHFKAAAGIMVTASHNPAEDNGYKVYFNNGAQINTPMDMEIAQSIRENLKPRETAWAINDIVPTGLYQQVLSDYISQVSKYAEKPDPDFPTVKFPNPEEAGALDLAMQTADQGEMTLIIANDPDADRFAVAEKVDGKWFTLTGNHVGVLLASHIFDSIEATQDPSRTAVLTTAVSSGMIQKMAAARGVHFVETLTGFKWMGNVARKLEEDGYTVPFAYEEALGYMFPSVCYDKDGITAAMVFLAAEAKWRAQGLTVHAKLQQLFSEFGHHETLNNYFRSPNSELTMQLFRGIRGGRHLAERKFGSFQILRWRDLTEGYDSETPDNKPDLPVDSSSQMLTLWLNGGVRFTIRGSGTEPKVKVYIESCGSSREEAVKAVCDIWLTVMTEWIQPFTPSMTCSKELPTSSGHILNIN